MLLIEAFSRLQSQQENIGLILCGPHTNERYVAKLQAAADASPAADRIRILPPVTPDTPEHRSLFAALDCFVLPSRHEPFGIVVLEAWSAGKPVIASRIGGLARLVHHERNGFHFEPGNASELTASMLRVAKHPELARPTVKNAQAEVQERYTWWHSRSTRVHLPDRRREIPMSALPKKVSLVMRSYNEAWAIEDTLNSVFEQDFDGDIELIVIDSASTDGSHEIIRRFQPKEFIILEPGTYVPGKVLNQGFQLATSDWVVFLNSDATPANKQWLSELLKTALNTPKLGAAFSRQIPRPDCQAVFAHDYERCFGPDRESHKWEHFFSMVSCVAYKPTWAQIPIREDLQYAEDDEWTRRLKAAGYAIILAETSVAIHSHNYTPAQAYKRAKGDAIAIAQAGNSPQGKPIWIKDAFLPALKDVLKDLNFFRKNGQLGQLSNAWAVRYQQRLGAMHGYGEGSKHV